jgi:spermidine synthase
MLDAEAVRERLSRATTSPSPSDLGIADDLALFGSFVAGPASLAEFARGAPLNTDDHPIVAYRAPRITYVPDSQPRDRLISLLRQLEINPAEVVAPHDSAWDARLAAYWTARDRFIEVGRDVQPASDVRRMLAQVRKPLLAVLKVSPDFRPAYDPLLQMAAALAQVDAIQAEDLLTELQQAQPARPEAIEALRSIRATSADVWLPPHR